VVAREHGVTAAEILCTGRYGTRQACAARKAAMRLVKWMDWHGSHPSYPMVGRWFQRDHTTILFACRGYTPPVRALT
jgi:chromosomal replication initiation ATPase DnaA